MLLPVRLPDTKRSHRAICNAIYHDAISPEGAEILVGLTGPNNRWRCSRPHERHKRAYKKIEDFVADSFIDAAKSFTASVNTIVGYKTEVPQKAVSYALDAEMADLSGRHQEISFCRTLVVCGLQAEQSVFPASYIKHVERVGACEGKLIENFGILEDKAAPDLAAFKSLQLLMLKREEALCTYWHVGHAIAERASDWKPKTPLVKVFGFEPWRLMHDNALLQTSRLPKPR